MISFNKLLIYVVIGMIILWSFPKLIALFMTVFFTIVALSWNLLWIGVIVGVVVLFIKKKS